jgi:hypothetical protein
MSLFGTHLFAADTEGMGQVTLPEPASDALIHELSVTGGRTPTRTVEPTPGTSVTPPKAGAGFRATVGTPSGGIPWAPVLIGGGVVVAGLLIWSATRRPTPNRRRKSSRRSSVRRNKKRRSTRDTEKQKLVDSAVAAGWRIEQAGSHIRMLPPDRSKPAVVTTLNKSDSRAWMHLRSQLRYSGLNVNRRRAR